MSQAALDAHFAGPAFLPWGRMGNLNGWGGPLPSSWHAFTVDLQKKVQRRFVWSDAIRIGLIVDPISGVKLSQNQVKIESHQFKGIVSDVIFKFNSFVGFLIISFIDLGTYEIVWNGSRAPCLRGSRPQGVH